MTPKDLIERLELLPQDLPIRLFIEDFIEEPNYWLVDLEYNDTGDSGYECCGEIRLIGQE